MSYDTLPAIDRLASNELVSHPGFGHGTLGNEVARSFAEHIKGKNGMHPIISRVTIVSD
jgi:hypothetical protein